MGWVDIVTIMFLFTMSMVAIIGVDRKTKLLQDQIDRMKDITLGKFKEYVEITNKQTTETREVVNKLTERMNCWVGIMEYINDEPQLSLEDLKKLKNKR